MDRNIELLALRLLILPVALRKESVDRNVTEEVLSTISWVALRKESVDRNIKSFLSLSKFLPVALRKESVDRNITGLCHGLVLPVALRKESVDRNKENYNIFKETGGSLSARRAWIEMSWATW